MVLTSSSLCLSFSNYTLASFELCECVGGRTEFRRMRHTCTHFCVCTKKCQNADCQSKNDLIGKIIYDCLCDRRQCSLHHTPFVTDVADAVAAAATARIFDNNPINICIFYTWPFVFLPLCIHHFHFQSCDMSVAWCALPSRFLSVFFFFFFCHCHHLFRFLDLALSMNSFVYMCVIRIIPNFCASCFIYKRQPREKDEHNFQPEMKVHGDACIYNLHK